jgi:hypothetical protein
MITSYIIRALYSYLVKIYWPVGPTLGHVGLSGQPIIPIIGKKL